MKSAARGLLPLIRSLTALFLSLTLCLLTLPALAEWHQTSWDVMGTRATLEFRVPEEADAQALVKQVEAEYQRLENLLSPWIASSEVTQFNLLGEQEALTIGADLQLLIERASHYYQLSDGAFDITFAGAGHLYDYRAGVAPNRGELAQAVIGMQYLSLTGNQLRKLKAGLRIDLGGIAKGYALDRAIALLRQAGVKQAYLSLGGDSLVVGEHDDRLWQIGIRHPRNPEALALTLPLEDTAVSTSGDYERFFIRDGQHIHHILDPGTGKPSRGLVSVTILTANGIDADALSTTVFVLGRGKGLALINRLLDTSAILIDENGKVHYSDDLVATDGMP